MNPLAQLQSALAGRYRFIREIGVGGMATVYLSDDVRHERRVALKVLNPELGAVLGTERFLAEIRVTANLQHPNLLPLFDSGEADGLLYYVMPFVEGESLRARLDRERQLPIDEALRIATAVASALDYAHRHAVIHRDLKPENILLHEGQPLVADFGIALAVSTAGGNRITQTGLSLGTPHYMSPEQATGDRSIDGRTDVYSLGAVLYECLTGEPPHTGSTSQQVIARVLTDKPRPIRASRELVPLHVDAAVERALAKLPADRFATAHDFAVALGQPASGAVNASQSVSAPTMPTRQVTISVPTPTIRSSAPWLLAAAGLGVAAWALSRPTEMPSPLHARFELVLSDSVQLRPDVGRPIVALSPDGSRLVYVGGSRQGELYSRPVNALQATRIPGTERARNPRFSPDGEWLMFEADSRLRKIPVAGGPAVTITDSAARASWGDGGVVVFQRPGRASEGLWRVSAGGGRPERITRPDTGAGEAGHTWPEVLPGGRSMLFVITRRDGSNELAAMRLDDRRVIRLGVPGANPRYVPTGHVLLGSFPEGTVSAVPFDVGRLAVTGAAVNVLEDVLVGGGGATHLAVSSTGTLTYVEGSPTSQMVLVDHAGVERPLLASGQTQRRFAKPRISPTGARVAVLVSDGFATPEIWIYTVESRTLSRFTTDGPSAAPGWTADGRRLTWRRVDRSTLMWQAWDGSGPPEVLADSSLRAFGAAFARSGEFFVSEVRSDSTLTDIVLVPLRGDRTPRVLVATPDTDVEPSISPDGRWLAYMSGRNNRFEVYVQRTSGAGGRRQVSADLGALPVWSPDGRTLYYRSSNHVIAARLVLEPEFQVTARDTLFRNTYLGGPTTTLEITPDGRHFLMLKSGPEQSRAVMVLGWLDELRERMATAAAR